MRHARIERWSRGDSAIHRRHAASKTLSALFLLIAIATLPAYAGGAFYLAILLAAAAAARLPVLSMLWTASAVLPFALCFSAMSALAGNAERAIWLAVRAYLSSLTAVLLVATTPMPQLMIGLEWLRAPRFLVQVMQFLWRYLFVLTDEAATMRQAALVRAGSWRGLQFRQGAAAAGVLFARSHARAEAIHRAMLSRGFNGRLPVYEKAPFGWRDAGFIGLTAALVLGVHAVVR